MSLWKRFRYRREAWACLLLEWGIPRLSRRACVALGRTLGALAYRLDARGRARDASGHGQERVRLHLARPRLEV